MSSVSGVADAEGASPRKAAAGLESEEALADGGPEDGGAGDSCIFFKLSNSGLELGAGREAAEAAGATAGGVNVKGGLAAGGGSLAEVDASSILSSKTLLNHCSEALLSMSRSSAVME